MPSALMLVERNGRRQWVPLGPASLSAEDRNAAWNAATNDSSKPIAASPLSALVGEIEYREGMAALVEAVDDDVEVALWEGDN